MRLPPATRCVWVLWFWLPCALVATPSPSDAQVLVVEPDNDACLQTDALEARVAHWLGGRAVDPALHVTVHAASEPAWFVLERPDGTAAERRFDAAPTTCTDRLDAIALAIAFALEQPVAPTRLPAQLPPSQPPPPPAPAIAADESARDIARHDRVRLHLAGLWIAEVLPAATFGFGAGVEAPISTALRLHLTALFTPSIQVPLADAAAHAQLFAGRVLLCGDLFHHQVALEGCGGAMGGMMRAAGDALPRNQTTLLATLAALSRFAVRWPSVSPISLRLSLEAALNVLRPRLLVEGAPSVARVAGLFGVAASLEGVFIL